MNEYINIVLYPFHNIHYYDIKDEKSKILLIIFYFIFRLKQHEKLGKQHFLKSDG